jgi:hypothetical protein
MPKHHDRAAKHQPDELHNAGAGAHQLLGVADLIVNSSMASTPVGFGLPKLASGT